MGFGQGLKGYGRGYGYSPENGKFEVKSGEKAKQFNKLSEAKKYFASVNGEKAIWDITTVPELLECNLSD